MAKDDDALSDCTSNCASDCGASDEEDEEPLVLEHKKHVQWWLRHLRLLPTLYESMDVQRVSVSMFAVGALDLLGALDDGTKIATREKQGFIDWLYSLQVTKASGTGFAGAPHMPIAVPQDQVRRSAETPGPNDVTLPPLNGRQPHVVFSFAAINVLALLRDDFTRLDKAGIVKFMSSMQMENGGFQPVDHQPESDLRYVYCAIAICNAFGDYGTIDIDKAVEYIVSCQTYEGGFGQAPMEEAHGGTTLCAVATLSLLGRLKDIDTDLLLRWLADRMNSPGFNGRTGKLRDTCYSFWCGTTLALLGQHGIVEKLPDISWLLQNQSPVGGIAKALDVHADVMHSYLGLAALSMHVFGDNEDATRAKVEREINIGLMTVPESIRLGVQKPIDPQYQISAWAVQWLKDHVR